MKTCLHVPMDFANTLKLRFRLGDLDRIPVGEEVDAQQMCLCGKAIESRIHLVGECGMHKEERDVLQRK